MCKALRVFTFAHHFGSLICFIRLIVYYLAGEGVRVLVDARQGFVWSKQVDGRIDLDIMEY